MEAIINIYGTLHNNTTGGIIAKAAQIYDDELGKMQSDINKELYKSNILILSYIKNKDNNLAIAIENKNDFNSSFFEDCKFFLMYKRRFSGSKGSYGKRHKKGYQWCIPAYGFFNNTVGAHLEETLMYWDIDNSKIYTTVFANKYNISIPNGFPEWLQYKVISSREYDSNIQKLSVQNNILKIEYRVRQVFGAPGTISNKGIIGFAIFKGSGNNWKRVSNIIEVDYTKGKINIK